jgi:hypothetical protein
MNNCTCGEINARHCPVHNDYDGDLPPLADGTYVERNAELAAAIARAAMAEAERDEALRELALVKDAVLLARSAAIREAAAIARDVADWHGAMYENADSKSSPLVHAFHDGAEDAANECRDRILALLDGGE